MNHSGSRAHLSAFLRSFLIQGSWNNRTMIGGGFAFALLPILRRVHRGDPEAFREALQRHSEHFNAHPYLANLALGAASRMAESFLNSSVGVSTMMDNLPVVAAGKSYGKCRSTGFNRIFLAESQSNRFTR